MMVQDNFYACDRLLAPYILGSTFLYRFVTAIFLCDKRVLMNFGSSEPIVRKALNALPPVQEVKPRESSFRLQIISSVVRVEKEKIL